MKNWIRYKNGNYMVILNRKDGTKVRETEDDAFIASFPECIDLKITNQCDMGCKYCHEDSTIEGKHGNILNSEFINTLKPFTELACLSADTIVYGKQGAIDISDLKIGNSIYDSEHKLRKIINIQTTEKDSVEIKGKKGFKTRCSIDHPFMVNNNMIEAINLKNKEIDVLDRYNTEIREKYTIDMSKYIKSRNESLPSSRGGAIIDEDSIRLRNSTKIIPKHIQIDNDLMWLYGIFVAEGSKKGLTLNINEKEYVNRIQNIWKNVFNNDCSIYENIENHSVVIELQSATLIEDLFLNEFKVGKGARNKSIQYLFNINNKELIRNALLGLFDGDGSYRTKIDKKGRVSYNVNLKTTSKKLAYEVVYILAKWFGVYSSVHHGIAKERKIENRLLKESDYYAIHIYNRDDINKVFFDRFDMKKPILVESCKKNNAFKIISIEKTNKKELLYDITLDSGTHIFPINGYFLTHNCGGGNVLSHPNLIEFLEVLKSKSIIANITVNQTHFMSNKDLIKDLVDSDLIKGLGVSLTTPTDEFVDIIKNYPNAVIHVINGIVSLEDLEKLYDNNLKLLFLGYKEFRRGKSFYSEKIEEGKKLIYDNIEKIRKGFNVVSFDNLAIKQIDVKRVLTDEEWDEFYMGDDGQFTMYIDLVERKFAKNSISTVRYELLDNIEDMFKIVNKE